MVLDFLLDTFRKNGGAEAVIWRNQTCLYSDLLNQIDVWRDYLHKHRIRPGTITAIEAEFSKNSIALMLALIEGGCIVVPLTSSVAANKTEFMDVAKVEALVEFDRLDEARVTTAEGLHTTPNVSAT